MATSFPTNFDSYAVHVDNAGEKVAASHVNNIQDAVRAIEVELGTLPKGSASDVKTRITNAETRITTLEGKLPIKIWKQATAPTIGTGNAVAGDQWYDTTANRLKFCNGTTWIDPLKYV